MADKGTLSQIAVRFKRKGVRADVQNAVHDCRELLEFTTHGFVTLAAMELLALENKDDIPSSDLTADELLKKVSKLVVEKFAVEFTEPDELLKDKKSSKSEKTRYACGYSGCDRSFVHDGVVRRKHRQACKYRIFDDRDNSKNTDKEGQRTNYKEQSEVENVMDFKHNYTCALMREGILDWCRHDAVREGDGDRVYLLWKHDFLYFHLNNHTNYKSLGFTVIAQQLGSIPRSIADSIKYNRFINLYGGEGHNVSLDYAMELFNGKVKPALKGRGGTLTDKTINRISQSLKSVEDIQRNVDEQIEYYSTIGRHKRVKEVKDEIGLFVRELFKEKLFQIVPNREHRSFPAFRKYSIKKLDGAKLRRWLKEKKEKLSVL